MDYQRRAFVKTAVFAVILVTYLYPGEAAAAPALGVECVLVEPDSVQIDGLLDDWGGLKQQSSGAFGIRCAQTEDRLFLSVTIQDETVIRTSPKANNPKQDKLTLSIGAGKKRSRLVVLPGTRGFEPVKTWRGKPAPDDVAADSMQRTGWAVELSVPLKQLAGWGRGTPKLQYELDYRDRRDGSKVARVKLAGTIRFAGATEVYRSFMAQTHLSRKDVRVDKLVDLDGDGGVERVVAGGKYVGVLNDQYSFLTLPVKSARDVIAVKVVDLAGEGRASVVTQYREHGNGGSRDVLAVWNLQGNGNFARSLAIEVRKQVGDNVLENAWRLEKIGKEPKKGKRRPKKGKRRTKGYELIVEAGEVTGWDEDSYDDVPPEDMRPILLPWAEQTSAVFTFEGNQAFGGDPIDS